MDKERKVAELVLQLSTDANSENQIRSCKACKAIEIEPDDKYCTFCGSKL